MGDLYAEDLDGPQLPEVVEQFFAQERAWHRLLRGTGLVSAEEAAQELRRWTGSDLAGPSVGPDTVAP
ncbi:Uncharacterised protein [Mycobacteroides abscessus subsp. abscessus]|uniref:hypothetical protein n=1 Tax=Mycobacteroides abscessus TaxID=36809 RepID=UPI000928A8AE|nr:hypothetical protein [Mycobacteroides abscessus]SHX67177.1 Uncharacterised protein [Mycobacteroides abscessus subsp. abscessus]SIC59348.1 Uncharacterised protein [Mycobacteroides abscessus subsp. abscessus]SKK20133.1 Uncharacterised protein [Mycobacteroides abscessus subsp. abscessus]SKP49925.1 Uncharacterised protein [Mycobacteroides abscessus subsp. abscessus]SKR42046.1 Uncharacterised protein [Mycobacteroides abscessus subsp. abscessus]